ncbi:hypothetical protein [Sphingobacterium corticibacterium]|uniref:DUF4988 domain-containing protein n=1 Tax=Sphingobacterium corticibacterium TaxID=2484746 RepID=A0A4Q6XZX8_9SPHI|nr:hypothetical protein [Sphingobacterium corticibacterium]RZF62489.1 hypothetical protein EWE74_06725 [Sphingobacterium corticibacterium]
MKIRQLSKLALAVALSSAIMFEGCQKYDDDIARLEQGIEQNSSDIASLKDQLATFAANNVVESVTSITGGFKINFKRPDGTTFSYDIVNGGKGDKGDKGDTGDAGDNGTSPLIRINATSGNWEIAQNGADYVDTGIKAKGDKGEPGEPGQGGSGTPGAPGQDGRDGSLVTIETADGKQYWHIDGENTGVQAYFGDIAMIATDGGYNVVFTDAEGNSSSSVFLATQAVAVNSLTLLPSLHSSNTPVVLFPRIVDDATSRTTAMQGYATITYNLNPFGVATANYQANGLLTEKTEEVSFRSSGAAPSTSFEKVGQEVKTFGDITVKYKPVNNTGNSVFPNPSGNEHLHVALQVKNLKAAENQQYVASSFNVAKEEIIEKDEVTIEKAVKNATTEEWEVRAGVSPSFNGSAFTEPGNNSSALALAVGTATSKSEHDFILHVVDDAQNKNDGGIELEKELRGFFARTQLNDQIVSLDNNGLDGYDLRFSLASGGPTNQGNWITIDANTGLIKVKESTPGHTNTAAVGNTSIVKADLYSTGPTGGNLIASRYVNVGYTQTTATAIDIVGKSTFTLSAAATLQGAITWPNPTQSLDNAYNLVGKSAPDFHATYNFTPATNNPAGFTFIDADNTTQSVTRKVEIDQNVVNPGTYTLYGVYESSVSTEPDVNVKVDVTVTLNGDIKYNTKDGYWENNAVRVFGTPQGTANWQLAGDLDEYIFLTSNIQGPSVSHTFTVLPVVASPAVYVTGFNPANATATALRAFTSANDGNIGGEYFHLINPSAPNAASPEARSAFNYITGWSYVKPATKVRVDYFLNANPVAYKSETIDVRFKNPVKTLEIEQNGTTQVTDKQGGNNNQDVDIRQFLKLTDYRNVVLWDFDHTAPVTHTVNSEYLNRYGITALGGTATTPTVDPASVTLTKAYYNANPGTDIKNILPQFTFAEVVAGGNGSAVLRWRNDGANTITQAITLEYTVTVENRYNDGSVSSSANDITKVIKVVVNPQP